MNNLNRSTDVCKTCLRSASFVVIGCALLYVILYMNMTAQMNLQVLFSIVNRDQAVNSNGVVYTRNETNVPEDIDDAVKTNLTILWFNYPPFIQRRVGKYNNFDSCKYKNCRISFDRKDALKSRAVLFDGRNMPQTVGFRRPLGQIWVFGAHESPMLHNSLKIRWPTSYKNYFFNWTMTYDKDNSDIHLPYGEIQKRTNKEKKDYRAVAAHKNKTAIMIASHCTTFAKRQEYVTELKKYVNVEILGRCGKEWKCGARFVHDSCFDILNKDYKFYLAFENAFCHQYFTEKFYENFNYDTIMVTRGGSVGEAKNMFPADTFISTDDFNSIKELGQFLKSMSNEDYAKLLERKNQYYSIGYKALYQRALCNICDRLNHADKYQKVIKDIREWAFGPKSCSENVKVV